MNLKKNSKREVQPTFIIGDEWLYYKFYTGPKTADVILTELIKPVSERLLSKEVIKKWFFIRFADPKLHIRVRFYFTEPHHIYTITREINSLSKPFIKKKLIWKIQTDSYQREVERYGALTMELAENLFFYDSSMIVDMLSILEGDEGEWFRWLFGLRAIDAFLDDFKYDMNNKFELITLLKGNFGREFGMNRYLRKQLEQKYRKDRSVIDNLLDHSKDQTNQMKPLLDLISKRSESIQYIVKEILKLTEDKNETKQINDLMGSYLHMMINRLFKTKQRLHEMVLYDFLHRHYKSEIARKKYSKNE